VRRQGEANDRHPKIQPASLPETPPKITQLMREQNLECGRRYQTGRSHEEGRPLVEIFDVNQSVHFAKWIVWKSRPVDQR
jgi:hypothetical protein